MPTMPFDNLSDLGPTNVPPRRFNCATFFCVLMLFHMLVLQAGQKITGFFWYCHATNTEVIRLSPIPFATLPMVLQVIGATITQSAQSQSARCEARTFMSNCSSRKFHSSLSR